MWRVLLLLFLVPLVTSASNAGIVRGLWYGEEVFFANEPIRVYVAIRNNTGADLSGTVEFFVNGKRIERNSIDALDGRIIESWADWTPSYGTSTVVATLSRTEISSTASGTQAIEVVSALTEDVVFVDYDTDKDGKGNLEDRDDDGDGLSDKEEIENGTDPLDATSPVLLEKTEPDTEEKSKKNSPSSEDQNNFDSTIAINRDSNNPAGLEQFLVPSRADTLLGGVTEVINTTKKKVDDYRAQRSEKKAIVRGEIVPDISVNEDGFGEIERISGEEKKTEARKPKAEKPEGFFGDLITFFGNVFGAIFTGVLFIFSFMLGRPALMQLLLLFLIIFIIVKIARRLGRRPQP